GSATRGPGCPASRPSRPRSSPPRSGPSVWTCRAPSLDPSAGARRAAAGPVHRGCKECTSEECTPAEGGVGVRAGTRLDGSEQRVEIAVDGGVPREDAAPGPEVEGPVDRADRAAGLPDDERAGRIVPGREMQLPEPVEVPGGDV